MASQRACTAGAIMSLAMQKNTGKLLANTVFNMAHLSPATHQPHPLLHAYNEDFPETNCYADVIIEIVHALGLNPIACLGYTLAADFEGDQWTFGKPSHHDLALLYGIRIEELSLYGDLLEQMVTQVKKGVIPLLEADAFHLPDTAGIDYRTAHVKTTIGITGIDTARETLFYFHNATFSSLENEDFTGVIKPKASQQLGYLPPYCEIVKLDKITKHNETSLRQIAFDCAAHHLRKRPNATPHNPIQRHATAMNAHQAAIIEGGLTHYHAYTFVALRQLGAAHQLGAHFLRWLDAHNSDFIAAADAFNQVTTLAKTLVLKLARVANNKKLADFDTAFEQMSTQWCIADHHLQRGFKNARP